MSCECLVVLIFSWYSTSAEIPIMRREQVGALLFTIACLPTSAHVSIYRIPDILTKRSELFIFTYCAHENWNPASNLAHIARKGLEVLFILLRSYPRKIAQVVNRNDRFGCQVRNIRSNLFCWLFPDSHDCVSTTSSSEPSTSSFVTLPFGNQWATSWIGFTNLCLMKWFLR